MKKYFCDYKTSFLLKKLGFNEFCIASYVENKNFFLSPLMSKNVNYGDGKDTSYCSAPTLEQAKDWMAENHGVFISIKYKHPKSFYSHIYTIEETQEQYIFHYLAPVIKIKYNPATAETKGIKRAVEYLHKKLKNEKRS